MQDSTVRIFIKEEVDRIHSIMGLVSLEEQSVMGLPLIGGPSMSGVFDPSTGAKLYNWFESFDKHDWLSFIEITSGILGMIPTPLSPVLLGISLAAGTADAAVYFNEGDPYMGGLMLALAVIPGVEFVKAVPGLKKYLVKGKNYIADVLKKAKQLNGAKNLSKGAQQVVDEAKEIITLMKWGSYEIATLAAKYTVTRVLKGVISTGGKMLFGTALLLSKLTFAVGKPVAQVAGIYYTYDEIYLALYGDDKEKMKLRYNSRFQGLIRALKVITNYESVEKQVAEYLEMNQDILVKDPSKLASIDPEKNQQYVNETNKESARLLEAAQKRQKEGPTVMELSSGKINPYYGKPWVVTEGMGKSDCIKTIQKYLLLLGYGPVLKEYDKNKNAVDGWYGKNTTDAVMIFQSDNNLPETGVVDTKTFNTMTRLVNQKPRKK